MPDTTLTHPAFDSLRRPLALTRFGMTAERATRCFWPVWSVLLAVLGALMLGLQDIVPLEAVWAGAVISALALLWFLWRGLRAFRMPTRAEALARLDSTLPGRPIGALNDQQAIGGGDPGSQAVWQAHVARMAERVKAARAVQPNLRIAARDPFALRYAAVLLFAVALLFGSFWRVASVGDMAPGGGGAALAAGPSWEGWVEPPAYTGKPSLYLADITGETLRVPEGSRLTLRLYGEVGALSVVEDVSGREPATPAEGGEDPAARLSQSFEITRSGRLEIDGPGGRDWQVVMEPDMAPTVAISAQAERKADGELRQPFLARDDYGVVSGTAKITLDIEALDRRYGLAPEPDPREAITLDLPLPFNGDRADFEEVLIDNFSKHPWANMPVQITFTVRDARGQTGTSARIRENLGGLRFFDPLAKAIIEQRRDLLWSRDNAKRVAQVLRAVSWSPQDIFRSETLYLKLRYAIRRLEAGFMAAPLAPAIQDEVAEALWSIAEELEYGDMADALERLRRAQDRLSEAMKNGASDDEIAGLMKELQEAMQDYMRQLAENADERDQQQAQGEMQEITGDQLQEMLDRIQDLMEQGRMAEAQQLLDQLQQMMENMQVTQGQQGEGQQGEGQQAMEDLGETLREQQGLSDQAFRDLQEQYNPGARAGESDGNEGKGGNRGRGEGHEGQDGQGQGDNPEGGQGQGGEQSLADRQHALRDELNRQQGNLPGAGTPEGDAAREALKRAEEAMEGAEEALRQDDYAGALDQQSDAMDALREGIRNLGEAMAQEQRQQNGQGQASTSGDPQGRQRDPLGREAGSQGQLGTDEKLLQGEDVYRRAEELLDEIRRRSGEQDRPEQELDYLKRLLDRF
ncbi:TIGR02302 family protein [Oceaniglobus trochenteri]|uniref:TIGR02302 family protein n=1 Tax=Oceaniglobus trochenteri TaxID=2763260 RepID=UPI001CFFBC45|nr:TIGR02302 family protein [Oceaniglobus trochenteri]